MKIKNSIVILLCLTSNVIFAHDINHEKIILQHWTIEKEHKTVDGSFYMLKSGNVFIVDANSNVIAYPLSALSKEDQAFALKKNEWVKQLNNQRLVETDQPIKVQLFSHYQIWLVLVLLLGLGWCMFSFTEKNKLKYLIPVLIVGASMTLYSFTADVIESMQSITSPAFIDSAFVPFKPNVNTFWDTTYFYVESKGIPTTHGMMVGISNHGWQQQVPIPQCYVGNNAWSIPLNPLIAAIPIPVDSIHFTRGAIAIAVNGVPIFNVHTNTGVDSYLDGQLDNYGGHCGRADDYHYHIAPLHLYSYTTSTLPIAFGLDGFAVYGRVEPDGTSMQTLDANHGHLFNGVYHYHGTAAAPYMIANMVGVVTEDATHQLIPQAASRPVRPGLTPLNGALITGCTPNATNNGYTLTYTLRGQTDSIVYYWNAAGLYTFNFFTVGNGTSTTSTYNGSTKCAVLTSIKNVSAVENSVLIYPNPTSGVFHLQLNNTDQQKDVREISIYNLQGELMFLTKHFQPDIEIKNITKGIYLMQIQFPKNRLTQKLIIQ